MRYATDQKDETRIRILRAASERFRTEGAENVRVADVMSVAGMTVGGFYKHFASKEQLFQEAVKSALDTVAARLAQQTSGLSRPEALRQVIRYYLSEEHLLRPDLGCALAALGTEMARMPVEIREEISKGLDQYAERLCHLMPGETTPQRKAAFRILFPSMAGCLMTARTVVSKSVRAQVLRSARVFFEGAFCDGYISLARSEEA